MPCCPGTTRPTRIYGDILPVCDDTYSIGSATRRIKNIYTSQNIYIANNYGIFGRSDADTLDIEMIRVSDGDRVRLAESWEVDTDGNLLPVNNVTEGIGTALVRIGALYGSTASLTVSDNTVIANLISTNETPTSDILQLDYEAASSSSYNFLRMRTDVDGTPDTEFLFRGDGNAFAEGAWTGGGADYAEYFEKADVTENLKYGDIVTVNSEGKVRKRTKVDEPVVGVIRPKGTSSVVGNCPLSWPKKHMTNVYGVELLDDKDRPVINKNYDSSKEYILRSERPEWVIVGLLGQIPVAKGQLIPASWILLRNLSNNVDLYLVK